LEHNRPIINVNHITKNFRNIHAVQDLNFSLSGGEIPGLLGLNGAVKTTTIRMILNIFKPDTGSIPAF
jgi:ABC-2 type transport system ATP-binding protein